MTCDRIVTLRQLSESLAIVKSSTLDGLISTSIHLETSHIKLRPCNPSLMKASLALLVSFGLGMVTSAHANDIAIYKRTETVSGTYSGELSNPVAGLPPTRFTVKNESFEVIDLTAGQRVIITMNVRDKRFIEGATENTIGYNIMPLKVAGTSLWYRGVGDSGRAEDVYNMVLLPGFDFFPNASGNTAAGDGVPDYFATFIYSQAETGKAGPVKLGAITLNVPTTISILGDSAEQYDDQGVFERGVAGSTVKGTVVLDRKLSTSVNVGGIGTLTGGVLQVKNFLGSRGFTEQL
jgi:hypothetical protein